MTTYLVISLSISSICVIAMLMLKRAPARLRFYICLILLGSWLTPWQFMQFQGVFESFSLPLNFLIELNLTDFLTTVEATQLPTPMTTQPNVLIADFYWLWHASFAMGLALFFRDIVSYALLHKRWIKHSELDNQLWETTKIANPGCEIRRISTHNPGMTTGLTHPVIWLDSEQHDIEKIRTIVLHELTHIRQHDPYWLWVINLVQRLLWWNPLIWVTARYARQQIELSCDEQCKKYLPEGSYRLQLIKLTLEVNKQQSQLHTSAASMPAILKMSGTPSFNLQRINKLNEEHKMKKRYGIVLALLLSLTGWIGFSNATVNTQSLASHGSKTTHLLDILHTIDNKDFAEAKTKLDKLTNGMDSLNASEQANIWKLYAHVLYEQNDKSPQILAYMDKALALEDALRGKEVLPILHMAQALAASQNQWEKQLSYASRWFEIADDSVDKKEPLFLTAVSHYSLEQYDIAVTLLNELVSISETQGMQPKEQWLNLLMANHLENKNSIEAFAVQEKITMLYPSEKNKKQLNYMSSIL